ncbi:Cytochrome P450 monooxygenase cypX [Hyphodiscus hymeniophilus]|uniref:Cytochrome P450 monooxygenase cypX n=1 Tax=Hyphodiscus hymeniophilus TaxID=353542 RepID=A0A9P7AYS3_9HELO|nr:Cytochrome P450 monooxygenase cypX [Hyphodiscus hymeniophilus]
MGFPLWMTCFVAFGFGWLGVLVNRVIFAPLSKLPGPWYALFTDVFLMYREFTGQRRLYIHELHKKFGPVVRLGPNEVSFTSLEALKEIYQSGGSGYDKTEFYNLFRQYGIRVKMADRSKDNVLNAWEMGCNTKHDQMKRYIAGPYAKTNILHAEVLGGVQNRADAFLERCRESGNTALDVYVGLSVLRSNKANRIRFIYIVLPWIVRPSIFCILMEQNLSRVEISAS